DGTELDRFGNNVHAESSGWYIDEVEVFAQIIPVFTGHEGFEQGWDGWYSEFGIWEVGPPTSGPPGRQAFAGVNCLATRLGGNYPYAVDSRVVSPVIDLPSVGPNEEVL